MALPVGLRQARGQKVDAVTKTGMVDARSRLSANRIRTRAVGFIFEETRQYLWMMRAA